MYIYMNILMHMCVCERERGAYLVPVSAVKCLSAGQPLEPAPCFLHRLAATLIRGRAS